jgi:hypothetical protein
MTPAEGLGRNDSSRRYRSAWIGIAVHSSQSVVFAAIGLTLAPAPRVVEQHEGP